MNSMIQWKGKDLLRTLMLFVVIQLEISVIYYSLNCDIHGVGSGQIGP